jgi:hypothetical protein
MEPLNDDELNRALKEWCAPNAPASLDAKVFPKQPWWRWLLTGSIRVPVPVGLAAVTIVGFLLYELRQPPASPSGSVSLADFQPIQDAAPQVLRSLYDAP